MAIDFSKLVPKELLQKEGARIFAKTFNGGYLASESLFWRIIYSCFSRVKAGKTLSEKGALDVIVKSGLAEDLDVAKDTLHELADKGWYDMQDPHTFRIVSLIGDGDHADQLYYKLEEGIGIRDNIY